MKKPIQLYSFDEQTNELHIDSLHDADYIDAATPSIPFNSVIADNPLPETRENQAIIIVGERTDRVFYLSKNTVVVDDYRGVKYYDSEGEHEITELGVSFPSDKSKIPPPSKFHRWNGKHWLEDSQAKANHEKVQKLAELNQQLATIRQEIADLDEDEDDDAILIKTLKKQLKTVKQEINELSHHIIE